ncbi:cystin 1 [Pitangus sulphuratus]|nr:cystin 1 [Pitangus sulphuratus]
MECLLAGIKLKLYLKLVLSTRSSPGPENNNADHQSPESNSKKPSGQSTISYDYSEEELMASIEREYGR